MTPAEFLASRPKKVCMVGLGPSANAYWLEASSFDAYPPWEQVWAVNKAAQAFAHDVCFHMHDLRQLCAEYPKERIRLTQGTTPVMTVKAYPEFPLCGELPWTEILEFVRHDLLNSTPAWMVAYALMIGVKDIHLYGMDFHYVNLDRAEAGGQGMAYLLGMAQVLGVNYHIPNSSSLLDASKVILAELPDKTQTAIRPLYGFAPEQDPRFPTGAKIKTLSLEGQMNVRETPRYRLSEAGEGDRADGHRPSELPALALPKEA